MEENVNGDALLIVCNGSSSRVYLAQGSDTASASSSGSAAAPAPAPGGGLVLMPPE